jgi:hypothetical protein
VNLPDALLQQAKMAHYRGKNAGVSAGIFLRNEAVTIFDNFLIFPYPSRTLN